jgi:autophagy-related protein 9
LKDDYKRLNKKKELTENLKSRILILALVNLVMMPLIFFWQLLYCFFNYAELVKREPGSLGVRKWSHFGRLYLRHLNELDHELMGRLNQAYKPANQYMEIFVSPMSVVIARFFTFMAGSVLAIFIALSVWDEDVLYVEHVLTIITILGGIIAISRVFIPDENMVFCPEKTLTAVIAHIHYFPLDDWKGRAHTFEVMSHLNELFPYTALTLLQELMSPIVTPLVLLLMLRPRASTIIDFFRNFTVDVTGVGDVCSFAQMDVRRHGNPNWQNTGDQQTILSPGNEEEQQQQPPTAPRTQTNAYTQAEDGKTEMSLIHFTLANPGWTPPPDSKEFISAFRGHATREVETLPALREEELMNNVLYSSLTSLDAAGGVYSDLANNLLTSIRHQRHEASSPSRQVMSPQFDTDQDNDQEGGGSMMQSIREGLGTATTELSMMMPPPPNLRQDLRRLGLEYTGADMSLSALFLHEMHQRSSASCHHNNSGSSRQTRHLLVHPDNVARPTAQDLTDLAEGPEENVPLVDTSTSSDSNKLVSISNVA